MWLVLERIGYIATVFIGCVVLLRLTWYAAVFVKMLMITRQLRQAKPEDRHAIVEAAWTSGRFTMSEIFWLAKRFDVPYYQPDAWLRRLTPDYLRPPEDVDMMDHVRKVVMEGRYAER